jgi:hypothetical protein
MVAENELDPTRLVGDDALEFPNVGEEGGYDVHIIAKPPGACSIAINSMLAFDGRCSHACQL